MAIGNVTDAKIFCKIVQEGKIALEIGYQYLWMVCCPVSVIGTNG